MYAFYLIEDSSHILSTKVNMSSELMDFWQGFPCMTKDSLEYTSCIIRICSVKLQLQMIQLFYISNSLDDFNCMIRIVYNTITNRIHTIKLITTLQVVLEL